MYWCIIIGIIYLTLEFEDANNRHQRCVGAVISDLLLLLLPLKVNHLSQYIYYNIYKYIIVISLPRHTLWLLIAGLIKHLRLGQYAPGAPPSSDREVLHSASSLSLQLPAILSYIYHAAGIDATNWEHFEF